VQQFIDENSYCITAMAGKPANFHAAGGVKIEPDAHLLAIYTEMASRPWLRRR
jgi:hypothetical protein